MKKILIVAAIAAVTVAFTGCEKQEEKSVGDALTSLKSDLDKAAKDVSKAAENAKKEVEKAAAEAKKSAESASK